MKAEFFCQRLDEIRPTLEEYGQFIIDQVDDVLQKRLPAEHYSVILKIKPSFRVKDTESARKKIIKKNYIDPCAQMTDVLGIRFVVLLESDIKIIEDALVGINYWTPRKDRTPLIEKEKNPEVFDYKSVHYVIKNNDKIILKTGEVPEDTPCEIQIRTLAQHAYAEFVHDRVYKGDKKPSAKLLRLIAKAMAMLESTDEIFEEAKKELDSIIGNVEDLEDKCFDLFIKHCSSSSINKGSEESNILFQTYYHDFNSCNFKEVESIFKEHCLNPDYFKSIGRLFKSHLIVPTLWLLHKNDTETFKKWPFGNYRSDLESAAALLGIAPP